MEIKIFNKNLNVGKIDYINLHKKIINCKNLKELKFLYKNFNKINKIDKNTFFQGITIYEEFVYTIRNTLNDKIYIGSTKNLISRMYSYQNLDITNKELLNDIIDYGIEKFNLKIYPSKNCREEEKNMIINEKNCYNIIYTDKKVVNNLKKGYNIGDIFFKTKKEIKDYCRNLLDSYTIGSNIEESSSDYKFAIEMIKLHPNYDGFLEKSTDLKLSIILDDSNDVKGLGNWNIFCFEYKIGKKNNKWGFSTSKIIKNL